MITHLGLTHFKSLDELPAQEITGLTLLCGTNSCGKSSFLQSLLLLRQSLEQPGRSALSMNGPLVRLGHFSDTVSAKRKSWSIIYSVGLKDGSVLKLEYAALAEGDDVVLKSLRAEMPNLTIALDSDGRGSTPYRPKVSFKTGHAIRFDYQALQGSHTLGNLRSAPAKVEVTLTGPDPRPTELEREAREALVALEDSLGKLSNWLQDHLHYVGPIRQAPERYYVVEGRADLGPHGENTVAVLMQAWGEKITYIAPEGKNRTPVTLGKAVEKWLSYFQFRNEIEPTAEKGMLYRLQLRLPRVEGQKTVSPRDVGYGLSQILPIVVAGLRAKEGDLLVFEQPEIHLHPAVQARLAEFLMSLTRAGKAVLVETHSEHVVNRLRLRVAQDSSEEVRRAVRVLFVEQASGEWRSSIRPLQFDTFGSLETWPYGFFDDTDRELRALAEAGLQKLMRGAQ